MQDPHSSRSVNYYRSTHFEKHSPYNKSAVTSREDRCNPNTCNAKVGTDLRPEFDSRYNIRHFVSSEIQELKETVQDIDESRQHEKSEKNEHERAIKQTSDTGIIDLKGAQEAMANCLREMEKIKAFLADENVWWKILKDHSVNCCQQQLPHLHGVLNGSSVTLMFIEDAADEIPSRFMTSTPEKDSVNIDSGTPDPLKESTSETKDIEHTNPWKECPETYTTPHIVPCYKHGVRSELIENTRNRDPIQRYCKGGVRNKQATGIWAENYEEDRNNQPNTLSNATEIQYERKERKIERTNMLPRETWYDRNTQMHSFESRLRSQERSSNGNNRSMKNITADFESNVDLNTGLPSRNIACHKPRVKMFTEKDSFTYHR